MSYTYDINTSKQDKRSSVCLFSCHTLYNIIVLFVSTFLVAHVYSLSDNVFDYIKNVAIYEMSQYLFMLILCPLFGWIVEKTNRTWIYRFGMIVMTGVVIFAIFYGEQISKYIFLVGAIYGTANAIYYSGYNTLKHEMVSRKSIKSFAVFSQATSYAVKIVVPIVMGALIDVSTYSQVAIYVLIVCAIQIGFSFGVRAKRPDNSSFNLKSYFQKLKENPETFKKVKILYWCAFIYGFTTIVSTSIKICVMIHFGSSFSLGAMTSAFSIVSIVTILLFNKFTKSGKRKWIYILSAILPAICTWIFCISPQVWSLILYYLGVAVSKIIMSTMFDVYRNGVLKEAGLYSEITEHQTMLEIFLAISRIISFGSLVLLSLLNNLTIFYIFLSISILSYSATTILLLYYENKYMKNLIQPDKKE